ncbi:MAG: HAMP domain-containing histidine kinase [Arcobacteraceae bacterium]|nr:HAMP domain-containing histidine kinase [Arcobacteraceae bacterium]
MKSDIHYNDILSMVTHDLKSPMTAIMGELDMLSLDNLSKKEKEVSIKSARKASKNILRLIESILVMAKIEAGKENIELQTVDDLQGVFQDIVSTFKYEIKSKQINFIIKIEKNLPTVSWDIDKLQYHCFNNIISNALKFTPEKGTIQFSVMTQDKNSIAISIKDDGIGICKEKRHTIFEKFDTHENQKVFKGNGLGLYNAYNFIKQHNGTIKVVDGLHNKGIGFRITVPINPNKNKGN